MLFSTFHTPSLPQLPNLHGAGRILSDGSISKRHPNSNSLPYLDIRVIAGGEHGWRMMEVIRKKYGIRAKVSPMGRCAVLQLCRTLFTPNPGPRVKGQALSILHAIRPYLAWGALRVHCMLRFWDTFPKGRVAEHKLLDHVQAHPIWR